MRMRTFRASLVLALLAALSTVITGAAQAKQDMIPAPPRLPPLDGQHLLNDTFTRVNTVNALPPSVLSELLATREKADKEGFGIPTAELVIRTGMADPDQPFERSDVVGPKPLPFRRLVFAGVSRGYCFVYNEYGGFVEGSEISLYRLLPPMPDQAAPGLHSLQPSAAGHATLVWQASLQGSKLFQTWEQLRWTVIQGRYYTILHRP